MATIKNIIQTIFTSQGAGDVNSDLDRVNKNVTRLGQSSSSAGRAFAAQSQGLGGLVAAYAGAAATVFALQQGFSALAKSARAMQTLEGLNSLAAKTAQDGSALLASVREITKGQITLTESAQQINLALSAGFNTKQIEGLSSVALKASRALGRDLNDAYTRVVRGSAKMETELLDELGIYTKIAPATRAYAAAIGKNVTQLSEFERRQAFVNAVITEGERKFSSINTTIPTSAEQIEAFGVKIVDLATEIGKLIADYVAPLAAFLTNNVAGAFGAVGVAASLVASKGLVTLTGAFQHATDSVLRKGVVLEGIIRKYTGTALAADTATNSIRALTEANIALQGSQKNQLSSLIQSANARKLTTPELVKSRELIKQNITALNAERDAIKSNAGAQIAAYRDTLRKVRDASKKIDAAKAMPVGGGFGTREFIDRTTAINRANVELRRATAEQAKLKPAVDATTASIRANTQALQQNRAALANVAPATQGFIAGLSGLAVGAARQASLFVSGFTGLFSAILGGASKLFFVSSMFTLIGSSIAGALGKGDEFEAFLKRIGSFFSGIFNNENVKNAKNVIAGITSASFQELEKTNSELRDLDSFKFKSKIYGISVEVEKSKQDLVNEVNSLLASTFDSTEKTVAKSATSTASIVGSIIGNIIPGLLALIPGFGIFAAAGARVVGTALGSVAGTIWDYFSDIPEIPPEVSERIRNQFSDSLSGLGDDVQTKLVQALSSLDMKYGDVAKFDPQARLALRTQQDLILASKDYLENVEAVSQAMQATGQSAADVVKAFKFDTSSGSFIDIDKAITEIKTKISNLEFTGKLEFEFVPVDEDKLAKIYTDASGAVLSSTISKSATQQSALQDLINDFGTGQQAINDFSNNAVSALAMLDEAAKESGQSFAEYVSGDNTIVGKDIVEGLEKAGYSLEQLGQLAKAVNDDIKNSTLEAIGAVNEFSRSGLRLASVQKTLEERLHSGSISLEEYSQSMGASKEAQLQAERYYSTVLRSIDELKDKTKNLSGDQLVAANNLIIDLERVAANTAESLSYQKEITAELQKQQSVLEKQITASDFFKSFEIEKPKNPLSLELEFKLAGDLTPLDELTNKLAYLQNFIVDQGADIVEQYNSNREALKELALNDVERQKILATSSQDANTLVQELNKLDGVTASVSGSLLTVTTGVERTQGVINNGVTATVDLLDGATGAIQQLTENAVQAQKDVILSAVQELPSFINKAIDDYTKLVKDAKAELKKLNSEELALKIKFDMDVASLDAQIAEIASNAIVRKLQFEADVITAKKDLKQIDPVTAAKQVEAIQQKIITEQQYLLSKQLLADQQALTDKSQLIEVEKIARQDAIKQEAQAQRDKILADIAYVNGLSTLYSEMLGKQQEVNNKSVKDIVGAGNAVGSAWAKVLNEGGLYVSELIKSALTGSAVGAGPAGAAEAAYVPEAIDTSLQDSVESFNTTALDAISSVNQVEAARIKAAETAAAREQELIEKNRELLLAKYGEEFKALEDSRTLQSLNTQKELQDAKKGSDEAAKKAEEASKKITEAYKDIYNGLKDAIRTVAKEMISFVGGILTSIAQGRVDNLKAQESQLQDALALSTSKLNDVSSRLEQTLSQETSQREELLSITEELTASQKEYTKSLGSQDRNIQDSSNTYVQTLLKQKRAVIDLATSTRKSVALANAEKKLSTINTSLQEQLNDTTFARVDAEEKLARTQGLLQVVTDSVTASSEGLAQGLMNLRSSLMAVMEVTGMVSGSQMADIQKGAGISDALGALSGAVSNFREGVTSLKQVNGKYVNAAGQTVADVQKFNKTMDTVSNTIGSAVSGFNMGNSIALALGKSGFATQIGGAIGAIVTSGAMGAAISSAIVGGLGVAVGSLGATLISFAVPIIGPILGALVGSLFAKTPKAGASTGFDASGNFAQTGGYASGGGSNKGYSDIMKSTYISFFSSLEEFGIELQKQGKNFGFAIDTVKKNMTASFVKNGQKILKQQVSSGEDAAKFFVDAFLKTYDKGDLLVKASVAYSETLQSAIDNFATKSQDERNYKAFNEFLQFASKFNTKIAELRGPATSTADAIDLITESAKANAAQLTQFYVGFLDQTEEVFGKSSKEYAVAGAAVRKNALAQIGLADSSDRATGGFVALTDAMESVNAGTVMIENAVANINAFAEVMRQSMQFSESEISSAIAKSKSVTINKIVADINDSLQAGIDLLENPAVEAVAGIVNIADNAASRISTLQGAYNALISNAASETQKSIAANNIALSNKLSKLEITNALTSLSEAELKAVVAAEDKIAATIREEAATRLAAVSATKFAKAQVKIADIGRRIASELSDLPALPNIVTSVADLMDLFETDTVTPFVSNLNDMVNSIARGENITDNFESSLGSLTAQFNAGNIAADQYTEGLDLVATSTLEVIATLEDMINKYEDLAGQIYTTYQTQVDAVSTAAESVGSQITDLLDSFGSATTEILKIYDNTLASVAKSGNELFDLKDAASSAFETAAKAVKEFEDANKLSGKSSSAVLADINSIQQQLNDLSSKPFDLAGLLQFSKLSSQQRALQVEYNKLTSVEQEYNDLLATRASAQEDLAFATATIDSLSSTLVDTRRTESEVVQKVQDAAIAYTKSQENLNDITKLLTESNFNLNQIRADETSVVAKTITLLDELRASYVGLNDTTAQVLSQESNLQQQLIDAATENYKIRLELATEAEKASMKPLETFIQGVKDYYAQLTTAASGIQDMLSNPINSLSDSLKQGVQEVTAFNLQISDQFGSFSEEISKYINLATASQNIKDFVQSLDITQNKFSILASDSGPLSSLNSFLVETYNTIGLLTQSGNYLNVSFERIKTAFGSIFTAIGTDSAGLNEAVVNISVVGDQAVASLSGVTSYLKEFATQVGSVKVNLTNLNALNIPVLLQSLNIDVSPLEKISDLVQVINLVDTNVGTIDLTNLNSFAGSIVNIVTGINSTLGGLNLNLSSNISTDITNFIYGLGDILDLTISLDLKEQVQATVQTYVYSVGNSITNLAVNATLAESARAAISTYVSSAGNATVTSTVNANLKNSAELLVSNYVKSVGSTTLNVAINSSLKDSAILAVKNYVESVGTATTTLTISSTLADKAALAIVNYVNSIGNSNTTIAITGTTLKDNAILAVKNYVAGIGTNTTTFSITDLKLSNSAIAAIDSYVKGVGTNTTTFNITGTTLSGNAVLAVKTYVESVGKNTSTFTVAGTSLKDNAALAVKEYVNAVGTNTSTFTVSGTTLSGNAVMAIDAYVKAVGTNTTKFNITGTTLSGNAILAIKTYVDSVGTNTTTFDITNNTLVDKAITSVNTYVQKVGTNTTTFSITGTTLSGNAVLAVKTYVEAVGKNTSTFNITATTLSGNATLAVDAYVQKVGTNTTAFNITGNTLKDNAVAAIKTYVTSVGTNTSTFSITGTTLTGNAVLAIKTYVEAVGTNTTTFTVSGTKLSGSAVLAIDTYVKAIGTNTSTFSITGNTLSGNAVLAIKSYVEAVGTNTATFTVASSALSDKAVLAIDTYVKAVGTNTTTFSVASNTLSGNAVLAIKNYVEAVGTNTTTFTISKNTLSDNAVLAIKAYVEAIGTNTTKFTVSGTTLSGNAIVAIDSYVKAVGTNTTAFNITDNTLRDNAILAIKTYVENVGKNTTTFTVSGTTLSNNAVTAIDTYVKAVGTNTTTFSITGTTLSSNAVLAIKNYVEAVGTNATAFTVSKTTLSDNAVLAIDTYVKAIGTNTTTFSITGTTLKNNAIAAIKTFVDSVGSDTTAITIGTTTLKTNAVGAVTAYLSNIGSDTAKLSVSYSADAGLPLNIKNWVTKVLAGTDIAVNYSTTTVGTLANSISSFVDKLLKGDSIVTTYNVATSGTLPQKVKGFIDSLVAGSGVTTDFSTAVTTSLAGKVSAFAKDLTDGKGITVSYSTTTANTLASKVYGYMDSITKGSGIDLSYNIATSGTLAYNINQYITSFKTAVTTAMSGIQDAFKNVTPVVEALRLALTGAAADGKDITTTQGLIEAIKDVNSTTGVSALTTKFTDLKGALIPLLDTVSGTKTIDGPLTAFKTKLDSIKASIQTEWNNLQISATGTSATKPGYVRIVRTGAEADPNTATLNTIATNSAKYPKITGASYSVANFAEGGHVQGPGTGTSDSIPANLSNGEFVVKASAVKNLGLDTLKALNSGMTLSDIMGAYGRNGDTLLAHINQEEAEMLAKAGGSGTINPATGLLEFFSKDAGAVVKMFADKEKALLGKTYLGYFPTANFNSQYSSSNEGFGRPERIRYTAFGGASSQPWGPNLSLQETYYGQNGSWGNIGHTGLFTDYNRAQLKSAQVGAISLANEIIQARKDSGIKDSTFQYAQDWNGPRWGSDGVNVSGIPSGNVQTGWGPYRRWRWAGFKSGVRGYDAVDGGWIAKSGQALTQFMQEGLGAAITRPTTQVTQAQINEAVDAANKQYGNSANLYMLGNTNESRPSAAMLTTGGLVQDDYKSSTARDSVNALLEPGEFVLRKQAVDKIGLDNAIRLNSTGDVGGDIDVEVNINNNGTSQTTVGTPEVRRENGKIVVDIILEDLRNNGPINRQIRSIR